MKKFVKYLLVGILAFSFWNCVDATTYETNQLIPVDSLATVETENFTYTNFIYYSSVNSNKKSVINFESIKNKSEKKIPVSINILLFDEKEKNIGYLTYCTDKDYDSNWAKYKLAKGASIPFSISVSKKYFAYEPDMEHVKYIAVQDDNPYCKVGGYSKYDGLTIDQITNGEVVVKKDSNVSMQDIFRFWETVGILAIIIVLVVVFVVFLIIGSILNALYKRMYAKTTALAYLPIACNYVSVKLAFGNIIAMGYLIGYFVSIGLAFIGVQFLMSLVNLVSFVSFIVVIVKLITKKYDLFYFEPSVQNTTANNNLNQSTSFVNTNVDVNNNSNNNIASNEGSSEMLNSVSGGEVVDLSYSNVEDDITDVSVGIPGNFPMSNCNVNTSPNSNDISVGSKPFDSNQIDSLFGESNGNAESNDINNDSGDNDSDLSKFFR